MTDDPGDAHVETDVPQFATVKEGFVHRHLTFVPLGGIQIGPDELQVAVTKDQVRTAPDLEMQGDELSQADDSTLYHHFELNCTPITTESGRVWLVAEKAPPQPHSLRSVSKNDLCDGARLAQFSAALERGCRRRCNREAGAQRSYPLGRPGAPSRALMRLG